MPPGSVLVCQTMNGRDVQRFDRWAPRYDRSWTQRLFFRPVYRGALEVAAGRALVPPVSWMSAAALVPSCAWAVADSRKLS